MRAPARVCLAWFGLILVPAAATAGLYSLSYGAASAGMVGATLASGSDALSQIQNPASLTSAGVRIDLNLTYLRSQLQFQNQLNDQDNERGWTNYPFSDNNFFLPAIGLAYPIRGTRTSVGFQFYRLGGDATRFLPQGFFASRGLRGKSAIPLQPRVDVVRTGRCLALDQMALPRRCASGHRWEAAN